MDSKSFLGWGLAIIVTVAGVVAGFTIKTEAEYYLDQLRVNQASVATGRCGDQQFVVLDRDRVVIAGNVVRTEEVSNYKFREISEQGFSVLRVLYGERVIMERRTQER